MQLRWLLVLEQGEVGDGPAHCFWLRALDEPYIDVPFHTAEELYAALLAATDRTHRDEATPSYGNAPPDDTQLH